MATEILFYIIVFMAPIVAFLLGAYCGVRKAKFVAIKYAACWVYNIAPRHMMVDSEGDIKMSVEGLRAFEDYMRNLGDKKNVKSKK